MFGTQSVCLGNEQPLSVPSKECCHTPIVNLLITEDFKAPPVVCYQLECIPRRSAILFTLSLCEPEGGAFDNGLNEMNCSKFGVHTEATRCSKVLLALQAHGCHMQQSCTDVTLIR